jgi:serine protease Do
VVRVSTERKISIQPPTISEDMRRRLQRQLPQQRNLPRRLGKVQTVTRRSSGSGIILDKEGHILTCNHVLSDADKITVTTAEGRSFEATVRGTDQFTDVAVLKVEADGLKPATLGEADEMYVGQPLIAIGWPDGLDSSVSFGVISALHQPFGAAPVEDFIHFDANVANGGAGGPLVNLRGDVVGLIAGRMDGGAVATSVEGRMEQLPGGSGEGFSAPTARPTNGPMMPGASGGPGFAIPINLIEEILDELKSGNPVKRGFLGIYGKDLTPDAAAEMDYEGDAGIVIDGIMDASPAEESGLETGDVIVSANGTDLSSFQELRMMLARAKPGDVFTLKVWTEGETRTIKVELGERPNR